MRENLVAPADRLVDRSSEMWPGPRRKQPHSVLGAKSTVDGGGACGAGRGGVPGVRFVHAGCRGAAFAAPAVNASHRACTLHWVTKRSFAPRPEPQPGPEPR
jgi:hypothetical protein